LSNLPDDLRPLPTTPWDERPTELPLDTEECRTALWMTAGNVTKAAELLKVVPLRLRAKVKSSPRLSAELAEAREQLVDIAEENVRDALTDTTDPGRRDSMSRFVLASIGKSRGFGSNTSKTTINAFGNNMSIKWDDGSVIIGNDDTPNEDAKVIDAVANDG
jgi:hypothetical protein